MDYPNMSYCAAENTLAAIQQLCGLIESGEKTDVVTSGNGHEYRAIKELVEQASYLGELCENLIEEHYETN